MPTSYDTNLHFLAKKAKNRLVGRNEEDPAFSSQYTKKINETYALILKMAVEEETVYNPISRFVGKDLKSIPDSSDKVRTVLETSSHVSKVKKIVQSDLIKKLRRGEQVEIEGVEYDPMDILRKLQ